MSTYADLLAQKIALDKQIEIARQAEAARALESVREMVQEFGFTAQQVFPQKNKRRRLPRSTTTPRQGQLGLVEGSRRSGSMEKSAICF